MRKLGVGLGVGGPVLIGTAVYFGHRAREQSRSTSNFCRTGCTGRTIFEQAGQASASAQRLLMGAGVAAIAGAGGLLWATRDSTRTKLSLDVHGGGPVALLKGTF